MMMYSKMSAGIILTIKLPMTTYIEEHQSEKCSLEIHECECGFHIGIDATYLEQVGSIQLNCPSCGDELEFEGSEEDDF